MARQEPDWSLWRSFAAVVEEGSLSAAARRLGLSQPTLGRHIDTLEKTLDTALFERTLSGLKATEQALRLYEPVLHAQTSLAEAAILAEGSHAELEGTVRITSSTVTSHFILPPLLRDLRNTFPQIDLELVPSDSVENLLLREADIAIRMFRPTQLELITRKIADSAIVTCAHRNYLDRRGTPRTIADLADHDLVGLDRSTVIIDVARKLGLELTRDAFALRTDSQTAGWLLLTAGLGIGFAQDVLVRTTPGMVALPIDGLNLPPLEVWLTTHRELFTSRRIRATYDRLAETLSAALRGAPATPT